MAQFSSIAVATAVTAALQVAAAGAQNAAPELDEVVVTAQKAGVQSLQSVPLAIQAFTGDELKEKNISSIGDLMSAIPGAFEGQRQSAASRSYNLRGA
ncbi:MAG: Plug domain-containing protein, partial [Steroidobacteraceae bacterium]